MKTDAQIKDDVGVHRLTCGHVGCCASSPLRHARGHAYGSGHHIVRSFEPAGNWRWCYVDETHV